MNTYEIRSITAIALTRYMTLRDGSRITNISRGSVNTYATLSNGRTLAFRHDERVSIRAS